MVLYYFLFLHLFSLGFGASTESPESKLFLTNNVFRPQVVVPTPAQLSHEPGLPPGWTRPPTRPTQRPIPVTEYINRLTNVTDSIEENLEPDRGVIEWILGVFNPLENNVEVDQRKCPLCSCGLTYKHNRIVGGTETQVNEYPWMTILTYGGRFYCAASVINNKYLLTAAHCVSGFTKDNLKAIFLDHDRSSATETKIFTRRIKEIIRHRSYNQGGAYNNDIALLKVDEELPFTGILKPVCLPTAGKSYTGHEGVVTGWGATEEQGMVSKKLLEVKVPIFSNDDCRKTGYKNKITDNMMCAGYLEGKKDSCQGDSGGPMHVINGSFYSVAGVVSWGEGCAQANYPGVYTRVNRYISWIRGNTRDACYCTPALIK